jgi:hypothetical protein
MVALVVVAIIVLYFLLRRVSYYEHTPATDTAAVPMTCMCSQGAAAAKTEAAVAKPVLPAPMPDTSMAPSPAQMMGPMGSMGPAQMMGSMSV